ncbi:hypothetical protein DD630_33805 [Streptomyces sp. BSE7F]|nr:hypothetical protein DD630_33805 [Streptomyces sp. BSE7F]
MFRGVTARAVVSVLAAALLTLQLLTLSTAFAPAYSVRHVEAKTQFGIQPSGEAPSTGTELSAKALRDDTVKCRSTGRHENSSGLVGIRDRLRTADTAPKASDRQLLRRDPSAEHQPAGPADAHQRTSRSSTAHSPAALQLFRC